MSRPPRNRSPKKRRRAQPYTRDLLIERLGGQGDGMAGDIAVPFALPAERVTAEIGGNTAHVLTINEASPSRVAPQCPHFGRPGDACGGCHIQHLGSEGSLEWKAERLRTVLSGRLGEIPLVEAFQSAPRTRRRARIAFERRGKEWVAGFRQRRTHRIVPVRECAILAPAVFSAMTALRGSLPGLVPTTQRLLEASLQDSDAGIDCNLVGIDEPALGLTEREAFAHFAETADLARLSIENTPMAERRTPHITFGGTAAPLPTDAFLQATPDGETAMQHAVLAACSGCGEVADLFCGLGTFSLPLARRGPVTAVDSEHSAISALQRAAGRAGLPLTAAARNLFDDPLSARELQGFGAVVFDPPRAGALVQAEALAQSDVPRIVAVSCNPVTLARDLGCLQSRYDLTSLLLVDQFLWSPHIEVVAVLNAR